MHIRKRKKTTASSFLGRLDLPHRFRLFSPSNRHNSSNNNNSEPERKKTLAVAHSPLNSTRQKADIPTDCWYSCCVRIASCCIFTQHTYILYICTAMHIYSELTHKKGEQKEISVETHKHTHKKNAEFKRRRHAMLRARPSVDARRPSWMGSRPLCTLLRTTSCTEHAWCIRKTATQRHERPRDKAHTNCAHKIRSVVMMWFLAVVRVQCAVAHKVDGLTKSDSESENRKLYVIKNTVIYENTRERS